MVHDVVAGEAGRDLVRSAWLSARVLMISASFQRECSRIFASTTCDLAVDVGSTLLMKVEM